MNDSSYIRLQSFQAKLSVIVLGKPEKVLITKQLVDRMDGSIELKSEVGVGTTVIVKIPFKIDTQDKNSNLSDKPVSLDDYSVEGIRALVVEDNELNMEIARCILEDSGMEVTCAVDGQEAVEIFEDCCFKKMHGR